MAENSYREGSAAPKSPSHGHGRAGQYLAEKMQSEEDSDLDQEFFNAMTHDAQEESGNNVESGESANEGGEVEDDNNEEKEEGSHEKFYIATRERASFLQILGEDILIRICSTMSASNLCEFAKTCHWSGLF